MGKLGLLRTWRVAALTGALLLAGMSATAAPAAAAESPTVVSLTFNDGLSSQYRNAVPVLRSHGMNGTFYVASNWVKSNDAKYMRFYHLDELVRTATRSAGWVATTGTYDAVLLGPGGGPGLQAGPGVR